MPDNNQPLSTHFTSKVITEKQNEFHTCAIKTQNEARRHSLALFTPHMYGKYGDSRTVSTISLLCKRSDTDEKVINRRGFHSK